MCFIKELAMLAWILSTASAAVFPMDGRIGRRAIDGFPTAVPTTALSNAFHSSAPANLSSSTVLAYDQTSTIPAKDETSSTVPAKDQTSTTSAKDQTSSTLPAKDQTSTILGKDQTSSTVPAKDQTSAAPAKDLNSTIPAKDQTSSTVSVKNQASTTLSTDKISVLVTSAFSTLANDSSLTATGALSGTAAVRLLPSSTIISPYISQLFIPVATEAEASQAASPTSNTGQVVVPVYTPELLGNAYGGGFIITPSVFAFVSPQATGSAKGVPPGYGFSLAPGEPASVGKSTILASIRTAPSTGYTPPTGYYPSAGYNTPPAGYTPPAEYTHGASCTPAKDNTSQPSGSAVAGCGDPKDAPDPPVNGSFVIPTPSFLPFQGFATRLSVGGAATLLLGLLGVMLYL